jgi:hypothetical protein
MPAEAGLDRTCCRFHQNCGLGSGKVTASECYVMGRPRQSAPQARAVRRTPQNFEHSEPGPTEHLRYRLAQGAFIFHNQNGGI